MLGGKDAAATLAVRDLEQARQFYEKTLGLTPIQEVAGCGPLQERQLGCARLPIRVTPAPTRRPPPRGPSAMDFDGIVEDLKSKGVTFEHYDLPDTTRDGDIHELGDSRGVWFKDPDGNILSLIDETM